MTPQESLQTIEKSRLLRSEGNWTEAVSYLLSAFQQTPNQEIACEIGLNLCFLAQEDQSYEWLFKANGAQDWNSLWTILSDYYHCRKQMAVKLQTSDPVANDRTTQLQLCRPASAPKNEAGISISACLIVKNEEDNLDACLDSLSGIVDEIVVVDTGSSDRSEEIARNHGAKVGRFEWCEDFSAARNHSIDLATGDWILWIDADERLTQDSKRSIFNAVSRPHLGGFNIEIINYVGNDETQDILNHWPCRLFRNMTNVRFEGRIHEQISPSLRKQGFPIATLEGATLLHYGYRKEAMDAKGKQERTIRMLKREVAENPDDSFQLFNLGNAYYVAEDWENSERYISTCLGGIPQYSDYGQLAYQSLAFCQIFQDNPDGALTTCENSEKAGFGGQLIEYAKAFAFREQDKLDEAILCAVNAQNIPLKLNETGDRTIAKYKAKFLEAQLLFAKEKFELSEIATREVIETTPSFVPAWFLLIATLECQGKADTIAICDVAWHTNPNSKDLWQAWVSACELENDWDSAARAYAEAATYFEPDVSFLINAGRAMEKTGRYQVALQCFEDAVALDPTNVNAFLNAGDLLARSGNHKNACEAYSAAILLDQENAQAWFVFGNSLYYSGDFDNAILALEHVLRLEPSHESAKTNLQTILNEYQELAS